MSILSEKNIFYFAFFLGAIIGVLAGLGMLFIICIASEAVKAEDGAAGATSTGSTHIRIVVPERITPAAAGGAAAPGALQVIITEFKTKNGRVLIYEPAAN